MKKIIVVFASILALNGCVSIATHEQMLRNCHRECRENAQAKAQLATLELKLAEMRSIQDQLNEKLKKNIDSGEILVQPQGNNLSITLRETILFESGKWDIQKRGQSVLDDVAKAIKSPLDKEVRVEGHTDDVPFRGSFFRRAASNWVLSSMRASAVVRYLEEKGVSSEEMVIMAFGEQRPVADNRTEEGRRLNRRVEILLIPKNMKGSQP